jgi:hypothetical protein
MLLVLLSFWAYPPRHTLTDLKVRRAMPAQIMIFLDIAGNLHAEGPGKNGGRDKIDLPVDFLTRNPEIAFELQSQRERERLAKPLPSASELFRQKEEQKALENRRIAQEAQRRFKDWYDGLTETQREEYDAKVEKAKARQKEEDDSRARSVWDRTASVHGVALANRVVDDPSRRPRSAKMINRALGNESGPKRQSKSKKFDPANVVDIKL